jgi:hypothetical protein
VISQHRKVDEVIESRRILADGRVEERTTARCETSDREGGFAVTVWCTEHGETRVKTVSLRDKSLLPFEFADHTDEFGFTDGEAEQRLVYPFHMNVPTRIYFDATRHDLLLQRDVEGNASLLLAPKEGVKTSRID